MKRRHWVTLTFIGASALNVLTVGPSGAAKSATYGPSGHRFSIAFPTKPKTAVDASDLLHTAPGQTHAYAYWVSPGSDIFARSAPVPPPSSFVVVVVTFSSLTPASNFIKDLTLIHGMKKVRLGGLSGIEFVGLENSGLNKGTRLSDPNASEGASLLRQGAAVFLIDAITPHRNAAQSFLNSFSASH